LIQSFGTSRQQALRDINTYITEHAPKNLTDDKQLKGYVPSKVFKPLFTAASSELVKESSTKADRGHASVFPNAACIGKNRRSAMTSRW
jgi:hypothetical protein